MGAFKLRKFLAHGSDILSQRLNILLRSTSNPLGSRIAISLKEIELRVSVIGSNHFADFQNLGVGKWRTTILASASVFIKTLLYGL